MLKKHVILFESKGCGWIAYSASYGEAKRMLSINITQNSNIFYIFECNLLKQNPYKMNLKFPFHQYYCYKKINIYKAEEFEENEECITISYDDADTYICLEVKHVV